MDLRDIQSQVAVFWIMMIEDGLKSKLMLYPFVEHTLADGKDTSKSWEPWILNWKIYDN